MPTTSKKTVLNDSHIVDRTTYVHRIPRNVFCILTIDLLYCTSITKTLRSSDVDPQAKNTRKGLVWNRKTPSVSQAKQKPHYSPGQSKQPSIPK